MGGSHSGPYRLLVALSAIPMNRDGRGPNGYRLFKPSDLAKLLAGKVKRPRRVPLDRVHRCSFLKNGLVDDCVQLVFLRPPTADAWAGVHPDRFVGFIRPYLEEAKRILARKASLILCAKESTRRGRDLYMVDLIKGAGRLVGQQELRTLGQCPRLGAQFREKL